MVAAANAGLLGHAVSSQSIVRHDQGRIAYAAPLPYAAPLAYAPVAHYAGHDQYVRLYF